MMFRGDGSLLRATRVRGRVEVVPNETDTRSGLFGMLCPVAAPK